MYYYYYYYTKPFILFSDYCFSIDVDLKQMMLFKVLNNTRWIGMTWSGIILYEMTGIVASSLIIFLIASVQGFHRSSWWFSRIGFGVALCLVLDAASLTFQLSLTHFVESLLMFMISVVLWIFGVALFSMVFNMDEW